MVAVAISPLAQDVPAEKPKPQPVDKRIRVSEGVLDNIVLKKVLPQPPWSNDKAHEKGVVTISVLVDYDGTLKSTSLISGDPVLADVAPVRRADVVLNQLFGGSDRRGSGIRVRRGIQPGVQTPVLKFLLLAFVASRGLPGLEYLFVIGSKSTVGDSQARSGRDFLRVTSRRTS